MPINGHPKSSNELEELESELQEAQHKLDEGKKTRDQLLRIQFWIIVVIALLAGMVLLVMLRGG